jgi:hypothetical protein
MSLPESCYAKEWADNHHGMPRAMIHFLAPQPQVVPPWHLN